MHTPEPTASKYAFVATRAAFEAFVSAWEDRSLPGSEFTHAAHIAIGATYVVRFGDDALPRLREGIMRFNEAAGGLNSDTSGYHETMTRFWWMLLRAHASGETDAYMAARRAVEEFGARSRLHTEYYGFDVVGCTAARREWVPPDLRSL